MLPVLRVSLTHIVCSKGGCQMHEEIAEWLSECLLMNLFMKNKSLLKVDFQSCLHWSLYFLRNTFQDLEIIIYSYSQTWSNTIDSFAIMLLKKTLQYYFLSTFWKSSVEARLAGFGFWVVGDVLSGLGRVPQPHCPPFLPIPLSRNDCEEENACETCQCL